MPGSTTPDALNGVVRANPKGGLEPTPAEGWNGAGLSSDQRSGHSAACHEGPKETTALTRAAPAMSKGK
jgi:hypothetical protein